MKILLDLRNRFVTIQKVMKLAGYKPHRKGFIREDHNGRFHITDDGLDKRYSLHYDLYTDRETKQHFSPDLPIMCRKEIKRIVKLIYRYPVKNKPEKKGLDWRKVIIKKAQS